MHLSSLFVLVKNSKSLIFHEFVIKLFELSERGTVVLGSTLCQNIDSEVGLVDLVVIFLLVLLGHLLALLLEVHEGALKFLLLLLEARLDDLSSRQQSLLEVLQSLILDHDGSLFIKWLHVFKGQLLEDWKQVVIFFFLLLAFVNLGLALLHLVSGFLLDGLFKDALEHLFLVLVVLLLLSQLINLRFELFAARLLILRVGLMVLDGREALLLHFLDGVVELLLLTHTLIFVAVLLIDVVHLSLVDDVHSVDRQRFSIDLALLVVIEDLDLTSAIVS